MFGKFKNIFIEAYCLTSTFTCGLVGFKKTTPIYGYILKEDEHISSSQTIIRYSFGTVIVAGGTSLCFILGPILYPFLVLKETMTIMDLI